ncbi:MAG TPA: YciI family protein [Enhygromyxa sp.]|nr:YciI family protein [Enhygromyxa sp.]
MQYMLLIYSNEAAEAQAMQSMSPAERDAVLGQWYGYTEALKSAKVYIAGDALQPTSMATTVRLRDSERMVTDGPFAETKEQLGGYYLIEVKDLDEALAWAAKCPGASYGSVEVRPVMVFS